ncbi:TetR/AcrR family transcriptional regulator [Gleimia hominis]|uniref:TetR/AcrR family transcriptional regulator n=1 Tax=Gleimia hominis TaxID=595468 RepID=A0ABU3IAA2_9ACTO|nr:TetR/AcrR family transcriptional regulator [Gleimia hominis]MDT3766836.1 TetR/AcrR family transcriptional regulator [Gleimia hominis]
MARPRQTKDHVPANERIVDAYWRWAQQVPFSQITVAQLLVRAHCNRTTFYYHFKNLLDVRREAEQKYIQQKFQRVLTAFAEIEQGISIAKSIPKDHQDVLRYVALQLPSDEKGVLRQLLEQNVQSVFQRLLIGLPNADNRTANQNGATGNPNAGELGRTHGDTASNLDNVKDGTETPKGNAQQQQIIDVVQTFIVAGMAGFYSSLGDLQMDEVFERIEILAPIMGASLETIKQLLTERQ